MIRNISSEVLNQLSARLSKLYKSQEVVESCLYRLNMLLGRYGLGFYEKHKVKHFHEKDIILITYADMVQNNDEKPLKVLNRFCKKFFKKKINAIHILPFFPYSSDDGFSVIDFRKVNDDYGNWDDVENIAKNFVLMFDLVLNHASRHSQWFQDFENQIAPARDYFIEVDPSVDLSSVMRPRSSPVLTKISTRNGYKYVWTTFSDDQMDLNFSNPDVLFEFFDILLFYISKGAKVIRLDAIGYLWKEIGTTCINLPQTHEVVKLLHDIVNWFAPDVKLVTETNVPNKENLSYFGDGDEADMVYQFSLPPLLLHGLITGQTKYLTKWAQSLEDLPKGCTFFNFTASHDGIGVRPLHGIVPDSELTKIADHVKAQDGQVSMKRNSDGSESPYELNITYFDALGDKNNSGHNNIDIQIEKFITSQAIALSMKGVPGIYFNSLTGTKNYLKGMQETGRARTINRMKWDEKNLINLLEDKNSHNGKVFKRYLKLIDIRRNHIFFSPNADQKILNLGDKIFCFLRISEDNKEIISCISNFSNENITLSIDKCFGKTYISKKKIDLISKKKYNKKDTSIKIGPYQTIWLKDLD